LVLGQPALEGDRAAELLHQLVPPLSRPLYGHPASHRAGQDGARSVELARRRQSH